MVSGVGRWMSVLDGGGDRRRGRGSFGGEFESLHCNQWGLCDAALPNLLWAGLVMVVLQTTTLFLPLLAGLLLLQLYLPQLLGLDAAIQDAVSIYIHSESLYHYPLSCQSC